jgi:hypothetical protein
MTTGTDQLPTAQNRLGARNPIPTGQCPSPAELGQTEDQLQNLLHTVLATATVTAGHDPRKRRTVAKPRPIKRALKHDRRDEIRGERGVAKPRPIKRALKQRGPFDRADAGDQVAKASPDQEGIETAGQSLITLFTMPSQKPRHQEDILRRRLIRSD